jgi:hypothetical protein
MEKTQIEIQQANHFTIAVSRMEYCTLQTCNCQMVKQIKKPLYT